MPQNWPLGEDSGGVKVKLFYFATVHSLGLSLLGLGLMQTCMRSRRAAF